ncbi:MAG: hypothetical protein ACRD59_05395 [Candidatus Acidiferrales bacterium]
MATLVVCWFVYVGVVAAWHSKVRYAVQYGVTPDDVYKSERPHDCDFLKAPIGEKECHFEAHSELRVVLTHDNPWSNPVASYDNGKTWVPNDTTPPAKAERYVTVSWEKVED